MQPTKLYSRNVNVDIINENMLRDLKGKEMTFKMTSHGFSKLVDNLKKNCLAPESLKLKIGAEVMFVKNDPKGNYVNGTRGVVTDFEKDEENPIVKTYNQKYLSVYPETWKYEENDVIRAMIQQIPLRLAWAITIHKSQGMTLDAAEMDLGDTFEPGMGYVALSRVRSLSGLKLMNLNDMALKVHPVILQQDKIFKHQSLLITEDLENTVETEISKIQAETLTNRFSGMAKTSCQSTVAPQNKKIKKKVLHHLQTLDLLKKKISIELIAEKLCFTKGTIIKHLEKLKGLNSINSTDLEYLKSAFTSEDFSVLLETFQQSPDGRLTPIFEKFQGRFSYDQLKILRLFVD
jgi:ATP-dependent DNA helicase PIF1